MKTYSELINMKDADVLEYFSENEIRSYRYIAVMDDIMRNSNHDGGCADAYIVKADNLYLVYTFQIHFGHYEVYGVFDKLEDAVKELECAVTNLIDSYKQLDEENDREINPDDYYDWTDTDTERIINHFKKQ